MKKVSHFKFIYILLPLFILSLTVLIFSSAGPSSDSVEKYITDKAIGVFVVNIKEISSKGLFDEIFTEGELESTEIRDFEKKTGISFKKDLDSIIVVPLDIKKDEGEFDAYFILTGNFNPDRLVDYLKNQNTQELKSEVIDGNTVYFTQSMNEWSDEITYFSFYQNKAAVISNCKEKLMLGINTINGKSPNITKNPKISSILSTVNKNYMAWGFLAIPENIWKEEGEEQALVPLIFRKIDHVSFGGSYDGNAIEFEFEVFLPTLKDVEDMYSTIFGFKELAKLGTYKNNPEAVKILEDKILINKGKHSVKVHVNLLKSELEKFSEIDVDDESFDQDIEEEIEIE